MSAALLFSPLESALAKGRGVDDSLNTVAAATLTGVLYRSTGTIYCMCVCVCVCRSAANTYMFTTLELIIMQYTAGILLSNRCTLHEIATNIPVGL